MTDEIFEEEGSDEEPMTVAEAVGAEPAVVPDVVHEIAGSEIGFRRPKRGQFVALNRIRDAVSRDLKRIAKDSKLSEEEKFDRASHLVFSVDMAILDLVESLIIDSDDASFVANALLVGTADITDITDVLFATPKTVDDDEDPVAAVSKRPVRKAAARKVANAKRSRK